VCGEVVTPWLVLASTRVSQVDFINFYASPVVVCTPLYTYVSPQRVAGTTCWM
jgi:hypothetical protein